MNLDFSTATVDGPSQLLYWRQVVSEAFVPYEVAAPWRRTEGFRGAVTAQAIAGMQVATVDADPHTVLPSVCPSGTCRFSSVPRAPHLSGRSRSSGSNAPRGSSRTLGRRGGRSPTSPSVSVSKTLPTSSGRSRTTTERVHAPTAAGTRPSAPFDGRPTRLPWPGGHRWESHLELVRTGGRCGRRRLRCTDRR